MRYLKSMKFLIPFFLILLTLKVDAQLIYTDKTFDDNIRTIQMRNVFPIGSSSVLEFDYLGGDGPYMLAKIIHCNWDWTQSNLMENEFMSEFNEFQLNDVESSSSEYISYYHYRFRLPKVRMSGNYALIIFDEDNPKKTYMYRRFSVYEDKVLVGSSLNLANVVKNRYTHQQVDFHVTYPSYQIQDPYQNMHVVVRQNQRWDNAKKDLKPTYINEADKLLKFNFYNGESSFNGGAEYWQIAFGRQSVNINNFENTNEGTHFYLRDAINRSTLNYSDIPDNNGYFDVDSPYDADYSFVHFGLKSEKLPNNVYVFGQLSDWQLQDYFKMDYDSTAGKYEKTILLKNGEYDYSFALDREGKSDEVYFQGSHSETTNSYDILIYYRPFGKINDLLIGFKRVD